MSEEKKRTYTGYTSARGKSAIEYAKRSLKRIPLDVPKEKYEEIKDAATASGDKVNTYIKNAIDAKMYQVTLELDTFIMLNEELQEAFEKLLMENSDFIKSFSCENVSTGENRLILQFIKNDSINSIITEQYCKLLDQYSIKYSRQNDN